MGSWEECKQVVENFVDHYSLSLEQQKFVYDLCQQIPQNGVAMEIGICNGRTAAVLGYCAKHVGFEAHGIDCFILEGSPFELKNKFYELGLPYVMHIGRSSEPIVHSAMPMIPWDRPLDFLLIDGDHSDPVMTADHNRWVPFVKVGGYLLYHDYDGEYIPSSPHLSIRINADKLLVDPNWRKVSFIPADNTGALLTLQRVS